MAEIVLGMWTTHGPTLSTTPEEWLLRLPADHARKDHPFRGGKYDFPTLVAMRQDERLAEQATLEERTRRAGACRTAIEAMADAFEAAAPDVAVIFGNDQNELFLDDVMPALTVFDGPVIWNEPASDEQAAKMAPGIHAAEWGHNPPQRTDYPGHPELGRRIIESAIANDFDVARSHRLPENPGHWSSGIGHAESQMAVRDPVVGESSLPRFLAPGDNAVMRLDVADTDDLLEHRARAVFETGLELPSVARLFFFGRIFARLFRLVEHLAVRRDDGDALRREAGNR